MLPTLSVERRCRLQCAYQIPFRIKLGMIFSTFEERAGDAVSIFGNSGTDLNCRRVLGVAHEKSIAWILTFGTSEFGVPGLQLPLDDSRSRLYSQRFSLGPGIKRRSFWISGLESQHANINGNQKR